MWFVLVLLWSNDLCVCVPLDGFYLASRGIFSAFMRILCQLRSATGSVSLKALIGFVLSFLIGFVSPDVYNKSEGKLKFFLVLVFFIYLNKKKWIGYALFLCHQRWKQKNWFCWEIESFRWGRLSFLKISIYSAGVAVITCDDVHPFCLVFNWTKFNRITFFIKDQLRGNYNRMITNVGNVWFALMNLLTEANPRQ